MAKQKKDLTSDRKQKTPNESKKTNGNISKGINGINPTPPPKKKSQ